MRRFISFALITMTALWTLSTIPVAAADSLISLRGGQVKVGGELELEFISSENNAGNNPAAAPPKYTNNSNARFAIDEIVLTPQVAFTDAVTFQADIEFGSGSSKIDEAWVAYKGLPYGTFVKVGLEDIFMKPHRKTESYPINGHAFFQDEDLGIYAGGEIERFYWRASITNGRRLADRKIQEDNVYPIIHDDDDNVEENHNKEIGLGVGVKHHFKEGHEIDVFPFLYVGQLSSADITHLNGISGYSSTDDSKDRFGINVEYLLDDFTFFFQYISATDGAMDRTGWYIQPSYKVHLDGRDTFTAVEFLFRYDDYNVDLPETFVDSRTWDRTEVTLAAITDVVKNIKIKAELNFHDESTGGAEVDNNELLVQLEAKF
ncbi:MAG: hypothetical protein ACE5D4_05845 [Thermodesulfobacteriota bacterium]